MALEATANSSLRAGSTTHHSSARGGDTFESRAGGSFTAWPSANAADAANGDAGGQQGPRSPLLDWQKTFSTGDSTDTFLASIANDLSLLSERRQTIFRSTQDDPEITLKQALEVIEGQAERVRGIQEDALRHVSVLTDDMQYVRSKFNDQLDSVAESLDVCVGKYQALDASMSGLVAASTTTGARLRAAHKISVSAKNALTVLQHMWDFSQLSSDSLSQGIWALEDSVDPVFTDDARLAEAAALVKEMLPLARDMHDSNKRLGLASADPSTDRPGTIQAALHNLIAYRGQLERRLVEQFHDACARERPDLDTMAASCRILAQFGAEMSAVKVHVQLMPIFTTSAPLLTLDPWSSTSQLEARTHSLQRVFDTLQEVLENELDLFRHIFVRWQDAIETLVIRIVEEKAVEAVINGLAPPDLEAIPSVPERLAALEAWLAILQPIHEVIQAFSSVVLGKLPPSKPTQACFESLFMVIQREYAPKEKLWLSMKWAQSLDVGKAADASEQEGLTNEGAAEQSAVARGDAAASGEAADAQRSGKRLRAKARALEFLQAMKGRLGGQANPGAESDINPEQVVHYISWHQTAIRRAVSLLPPAAAAQLVAAVFHRKVDAPEGCCLLDKVVNHVLAGLNTRGAHAAARLRDGLQLRPDAGPGAAGTGGGGAGSRLPASAIAEAVRRYMAAGACIAFSLCRHSGSVVESVQRHYSVDVKPVLSQRATLAAECELALSQFTAVMERSIQTMLETILDGLDVQLRRLLHTEQKRTDFLPTGDDMPSVDQPTVACAAIVAVLRALGEECLRQLNPWSAASFLSEVGMLFREALLQHMLSFRFSMLGALQWKRDASEYRAAVASFGVSKVDESFEALLGLANTLLVPPEALLDVVESDLALDRATVLKTIALRDDYSTAKVAGKPLSAVITEGLQRDGAGIGTAVTVHKASSIARAGFDKSAGHDAGGDRARAFERS